MSGRDWAKENLFKSGGGRADTTATEDDSAAGFRAWIGGLRLGPVQAIGDLEFHPLIGPGNGRAGWLTAEEAIERGKLEIVEQGGGEVGEVLARNLGGRPVMILEGETLVGCKQNRVVAHTVMVAPGRTVIIPVGCMEQGRWSRAQGTFSMGAARMEPSLRRETVSETIHYRRVVGSPALDQGRLWRAVDACQDLCGMVSPTSDYHQTLQKREAEARDSVQRAAPLTGQVGIVALWRGRLLGLELVGNPGAWNAMAQRTIASYALAAGSLERREPDDGAPHPERSAEDWLGAVRTARITVRPALDLGRDLELAGPGFIGSALWHEESPAHLALFSA